MNRSELNTALKTLRLSGMVDALDARILHAQSEQLVPIDFLSLLVGDELSRRADRLTARRIKQARFRDPGKTLDSFDFSFNRDLSKKAVFELATCQFINRREDLLLLGPPGTGKSHIAQALGMAAIMHGYRVVYREAYTLVDEIADARIEGTRKNYLAATSKASLLIVDDIGMRKLPATAAEDLLEVIMRRYERASTVLTSNRPVEDWGKLLGDTAAVGALLDRVLHHGHVLKCGPKSWRTKRTSDLKKTNRSV